MSPVDKPILHKPLESESYEDCLPDAGGFGNKITFGGLTVRGRVKGLGKLFNLALWIFEFSREVLILEDPQISYYCDS